MTFLEVQNLRVSNLIELTMSSLVRECLFEPIVKTIALI